MSALRDRRVQKVVVGATFCGALLGTHALVTDVGRKLRSSGEVHPTPVTTPGAVRPNHAQNSHRREGRSSSHD